MTKDDLYFRRDYQRRLHTDWVDSNFDRLMYFSGTWSDGTYAQQEVVTHDQNAWVCIVPTTTQEPELANVLADTSDWHPLSINPWGFGELYLSTPNLTFPNLTSGWETVTFDTANFATNTTLTPATGEFAFDYPGLWEVQFSFAMLHNSANSGRVINMRIFNVTESTGGTGSPIGIGRNAEATTATATVWAAISDDDVGDTFRTELGGGDNVTVDELTTARIGLKKLA